MQGDRNTAGERGRGTGDTERESEEERGDFRLLEEEEEECCWCCRRAVTVSRFNRWDSRSGKHQHTNAQRGTEAALPWCRHDVVDSEGRDPKDLQKKPPSSGKFGLF